MFILADMIDTVGRSAVVVAAIAGLLIGMRMSTSKKKKQ